jgi:hypothetical protein
MSIGPLGIIGSVAGSPLAQSKGSEVDRAAQDTAHQSRQINSENKAEQAAGIGQTEEDQESSDRDADGRRLWEEQAPPREASQDDAPAGEETDAPRSKDPSGLSGGQLDLTG